MGHLLHRGPCTDADFRKYGSRTNRKPADEMRKLSRRFLDEDGRRFERVVIKHVPGRWRKSQDRFNAFVSLAYNLGEGILTPEPPLQDVGRALAGRPDHAGVNRLATAIVQFDKAGSPPRPMPGLTRRRKAEVDLIRRNK